MFNIKYKGLRIEPTLTASRELVKQGKDLYDVLEILENGYKSGPSRRKPNIIEKSIRKRDKEFKAVVAKTEIKYPDGYVEEV